MQVSTYGHSPYPPNAQGEQRNGILSGHDPSHVPRAMKRRRIVLSVVGAAVAVLVMTLVWAYSYDPLVHSLQFANGEFGSYVGTLAGVEARYSFASLGTSPMDEQIWTEPAGVFVVQIETEITNRGFAAVLVEGVGQPRVSYPTSDYRVSFYRNALFPHENGQAFHPFTLPGHSQRMVVVTFHQWCATHAPSEEVSASATIFPSPSSLPVTYSFWGFHHTVDVPLAPFAFKAPSRC